MSGGRIERTFADDGAKPIAPVILAVVGVFGVVAVVLMAITFMAMHTTGESADELEGSLKSIEKSTADTKLATELNRTAAKLLTATQPVAGLMLQTNASVDSMQATTNSIVATSEQIEQATARTAASADAAARTADQIEATSQDLATISDQTRATVVQTAGRAQQAFKNIYFTQVLSGSVKSQVNGVADDVAELLARGKKADAAASSAQP